MPTTDPRVDAYIASAPDFARQLLAELRARVHRAIPEVVETIKWRAPSFECHGLLGGMAAFKAHCTFAFWKERMLLQEDASVADVVQRCGRLTSLADLPSPAAFAATLQRARECNEVVAKPKPKTVPRPVILVPPAFAKALARAKKAKAQFEAFAPVHQREYLEWIQDCKRPETRQRRIEQAVEWLAAGRTRNWRSARR